MNRPSEQERQPAGEGDRGPSIPLATIARSATAELRIEWAQFKGHHYVGLRQWNKSGDGNPRPDAKRGLSIKKRELVAVIEALQKALALAADDDGCDR